MKVRSIISRTALAAIAASAACLTAGTAVAQEATPSEPFGEARLIPVDVSISVGMHGDRYWDGHRYWAHDEWAHRHPHDRDPWNHDDRRVPPHDIDPHRY
jgi:hypothetical protein